MASLAMAPSMAVSMSAAGISPVFSSASSVKVASPASFAAPLRVSGASRNLHAVARASPSSTNLEETVQHAIEDAEEVCKADGASAGNCAAAWDEVEELAAAVAHKKASEKDKKDPLEVFCNEVPEADECRTYED
ncbi:unnamed protein product [Calypogeia fissa]